MSGIVHHSVDEMDVILKELDQCVNNIIRGIATLKLIRSNLNYVSACVDPLIRELEYGVERQEERSAEANGCSR